MVLGLDPSIIQQFAQQLRGMAKDAGTSCDMPGCDALTFGARCEKCAKRVCTTHCYWHLLGGGKLKAQPFCCYCVLNQNKNLFSEDDDDVDDAANAER